MAFVFLVVYVVLYISTYYIRSIASSDGSVQDLRRALC
jgi:hypothetical protein